MLTTGAQNVYYWSTVLPPAVTVSFRQISLSPTELQPLYSCVMYFFVSLEKGGREDWRQEVSKICIRRWYLPKPTFHCRGPTHCHLFYLTASCLPVLPDYAHVSTAKIGESVSNHLLLSFLVVVKICSKETDSGLGNGDNGKQEDMELVKPWHYVEIKHKHLFSLSNNQPSCLVPLTGPITFAVSARKEAVPPCSMPKAKKWLKIKNLVATEANW